MFPNCVPHTGAIGGNSEEIARTSGGDLMHGRGALALALICKNDAIAKAAFGTWLYFFSKKKRSYECNCIVMSHPPARLNYAATCMYVCHVYICCASCECIIAHG